MTRTIQWLSRVLNTAKGATLLALVTVYSLKKEAFLRMLARSAIDSPRNFRNQGKKTRVSFSDLPFYVYDRTLADAVDAMKRWILAAIAETPIQEKLFCTFEGPPQRYAFWLLQKFARIGAVLRSEAPNLSFDVPFGERKTVAPVLRRPLRPALGHLPQVHLLRSFVRDHFLYRFFTHQSKPYLSLASLIPGQRIVMPLNGFSVPAVTGNVGGMIHSIKQRVAIHIPVPVEVKTRPERHELLVVGLDARVTEVFRDGRGHFYGDGFGRLSVETSAQGGGTEPTAGGSKNTGHVIQHWRLLKGGPDLAVQPEAGETGCVQSEGTSRGGLWIFEATRKPLCFGLDALSMEILSRMRVDCKSVKRAGTSARILVKATFNMIGMAITSPAPMRWTR